MSFTQKISGFFTGKLNKTPVVEPTKITTETIPTETNTSMSQETSTPSTLKPEDIHVIVQSTPNPRAFKFIVNQLIKAEGKVTYKTVDECHDNPLAKILFEQNNIIQLHFFDNVITVTISSDADLQSTIDVIKNIIKTKLPEHNPNFKEKQNENQRRQALSPELQKIEGILDKTIRPGLQMDGGDLEVLALEDNKLMIRYQGACGSCPSSVTGTLAAIENIIREHYHPDIEVIAL